MLGPPLALPALRIPTGWGMCVCCGWGGHAVLLRQLSGMNRAGAHIKMG